MSINDAEEGNVDNANEIETFTTSTSTSLLSVPVLVIFVTMFGTTLITTTVESTLLLYLNEVLGKSSTFYVRMQGIFTLIPVVLAIPFGYLTSLIGEKLAFSFGYSLVFTGLLILLLFPSVITFVLGYVLYSTNVAVRVIRFSCVARFVNEENRTFVMAVYQLMIPIGSVTAPLLLKLLQNLRDSESNHQLSPAERHDFYHSLYTLCAFIAAFLAVTCFVGIPSKRPTEKRGTQHKKYERDETLDVPPSPEVVAEEEDEISPSLPTTGHSETRKVDDAIYHEETPLLNAQARDHSDSTADSPAPLLPSEISYYRTSRMIFIACIILLMNFTYILIISSFQPALKTHIPGFSVSSISNIYFFMGLFSILPPLLAAVLSRFVSDDRYIVLIGIAAKLIGATLYAFEFPIAAVILSLKGTTFFTAAIMSLFTKLMGPLCSAQSIGAVCAIANLPAVFVQFFGARMVAGMFGTTHGNILVVTPVLLAGTLCLCPFGWDVMDLNSESRKRVIASVG